MILLIILLIIFLVFFIKYQRSKKRIVIQQVNVVTGAPKTCKSLLTLYLARKDYKKRLFHTKVYNFFHSAKKQKELPLFYSTIPVKFPHVILTEELLLRKERFRYNSVIFIDEAYLVADSESFKDSEVNESLSLFNKLIGHELRGGSVFYNSQNIHDLHFAIKRVAANYIYIDSKHSWPFFMSVHCRELVNSEEVSLTNVAYDDPKHDPSFRRVLIPKKYFKYYDCFCYSKLTDNLKVQEKIVDYKQLPDLKTSYVVNIKHDKNAKGGVKNERKSTRKSPTAKTTKNSEGKKLFYVLLIVLAWICFIFGLMFASSKCSKATSFPNSNVTYNEQQVLTYEGAMSLSYNCSITANTSAYGGPFYMAYCEKTNMMGRSFDIYNSGTLSGNVITFTNYMSLNIVSSPTAPSYTSGSTTMTINTDSVSFLSATLTIKSMGYSQAELDSAVEEAKVEVLNEVADSSGGSGTDYTSYSSSSLNDELSDIHSYYYSLGEESSSAYTSGYNQGKLDLLNEVADFQYGGSGTDYTSYTSGDMFSTGGVSNLDTRMPEQNGCSNGGELCKIYQAGRYSGSQYVLNHLATYELYTYAETNALVGAEHDSTFLQVLNYISASEHGSGIVYNSPIYSSVDYEINYIYSNGVAYGSDTNYNEAYSLGYQVGQSAITDNPNLYDLYTKSQYDSYGLARYTAGYNGGYTAGNQSDDNSLPKVIISVASVPYAVLTSMFNFNVLDINVFIFITSLISLAVVIWVIKKIWK